MLHLTFSILHLVKNQVNLFVSRWHHASIIWWHLHVLRPLVMARPITSSIDYSSTQTYRQALLSFSFYSWSSMSKILVKVVHRRMVKGVEANSLLRVLISARSCLRSLSPPSCQTRPRAVVCCEKCRRGQLSGGCWQEASNSRTWDSALVWVEEKVLKGWTNLVGLLLCTVFFYI